MFLWYPHNNGRCHKNRHRARVADGSGGFGDPAVFVFEGGRAHGDLVGRVLTVH